MITVASCKCPCHFLTHSAGGVSDAQIGRGLRDAARLLLAAVEDMDEQARREHVAVGDDREAEQLGTEALAIVARAFGLTPGTRVLVQDWFASFSYKARRLAGVVAALDFDDRGRAYLRVRMDRVEDALYLSGGHHSHDLSEVLVPVPYWGPEPIAGGGLIEVVS
jgi:hypothetical protein